ncbi:MAG: hypothetical protein DWP97_02125 [Calditrichaeota bacterium]|nr:MAG: hypothetical protein DWP97_02125 [Calditrichota bacterium]
MNKNIELFFKKAQIWHDEYTLLRKILLGCQLTEKFKWGKPCYTFQNKNIVLIHGFKEYCALLFFKGALLKDTDKMLIQQTKNVQAARQLRITKPKEIVSMEARIKSFVTQAIEIEKAGLKLKLKKTKDYTFPKELLDKFGSVPKLKTAFDALTPGRQRGYLLYFSSAKQTKTRESRIEKYIPQIFDGRGLND